MSKCISSEGEYSEHDRANDEPEFVCGRCLVFDEDAAIAEIQRLRDAAKADLPSREQIADVLLDDALRVTPAMGRDYALAEASAVLGLLQGGE